MFAKIITDKFYSAHSFVVLCFLFLLSTGCSKSSQFPIESTNQAPSSDNSGQSTTPGSNDSGSDSGGSTTPPVDNSYKMTALAWETSTKPERAQWSLYLQDIITNQWNSLLAGASDITTFCPKYYSLDNDQRANAWAALFVGVAKFESAWSPTSRYHETTMGNDGVTGLPVYSEGLLQLSYQDIQGYPFCDFNWSKDRNLSPTDPKKDTLDPYKNLYCGVGIMAKIVARKNQITVSSGAYWSTLRSGGSYQHISEIATIVKKLPFCN